MQNTLFFVYLCKELFKIYRMEGYKMQERIKNLPLNISQLSLILTGNPKKIRLGRDPIPKRYLPQLNELVGFLEYWVIKNQIKNEEMELEQKTDEQKKTSSKRILERKI